MKESTYTFYILHTHQAITEVVPREGFMVIDKNLSKWQHFQNGENFDFFHEFVQAGLL